MIPPDQQGMSEPLPLRSITVWYKCEVCRGFVHSIPALKSHALTVHGVTILKLPSDLRPWAEYGKVFTDYSKKPPPKQYPYTKLNSYRLEQEEKEKEKRKEADNSVASNFSIRLAADTSLNLNQSSQSSDDEAEGDESQLYNANIELNSSSSSAPDSGIQLVNPAKDNEQPGPSKKSRTLNPPPPPVVQLFNSPSKLKFPCALCLKRFSSNEVVRFHIKRSHVFDNHHVSRNEAAEETDSSSQASDSDTEMPDSSTRKDDEPQLPVGDKADENESRKRKSPSPKDISTSSNDSCSTAVIPRKPPSQTGSRKEGDNQNTLMDTDSSPKIRTRRIIGKKKSKTTNSVQSESDDELGTRSTVSEAKSSPPLRTYTRRSVRVPLPAQSEMISTAPASGRVTRRMTRSAGPPSPPPASEGSFIISSSSSDSSSSSSTKEMNKSDGEESEGELTDKSTTPDVENVASPQASEYSSSSEDLFIPIEVKKKKKKSSNKDKEAPKDLPPSETPSASQVDKPSRSPIKNKDQPSTSQQTATSNCDACGMEFKDGLELGSHKKNPLECKGSTGPYKCDDCEKEYKDKRAFSRHLETHKTPAAGRNKIRKTMSARPKRRRK